MDAKKLNKFIAPAMLLVLIAGMCLFPQSTMAEDEEFKVAFVLLWECGDNGWTAAACRGIQEVKEYYLSQGGKLLEAQPNGYLIELPIDSRLRVTWVERAGDGPDSGRIIRDFAYKGYNLVFATTFGQMDFALEVAKEFPKLAIEHCSGYKTRTNMNWYMARNEVSAYVAGYVAGLMGYHKVGTVATHPIPEVTRDIDAFTLGVQRGLREAGHEDWASLPDLNTLIWLNSWRDPEGEVQAAQTFVDGGYDLVRQMADTPDSAKTACYGGVPAVGYGMDVKQFGADCALVSTTWLWGPHFIKKINEVLAGKWQGDSSFYGGFAAGMIGLEGWGEGVPEDVKAKALALVDELTQKEIAAREANQDVTTALGIFCGPILDPTGETIITAGACWTDNEVLSRRVFVYGIKGQLPQ